MSLTDGRYRITACSPTGRYAAEDGLYVQARVSDEEFISGIVPWKDVGSDKVGDILVIVNGKPSTIPQVDDWDGPAELN